MTPTTEHSDSSSSHGNTYLLPRDESESIRLNVQHYALTRRQGWLLHPKIEEVVLGLDAPQIADVACGTGIWAVEVAEKWPTAFVTGLDISADKFLPKWTLPANVTLDTLDLLEDIGLEYYGKFDLVHVRLLLSAWPLTDPRNFVKAFNKLLKPGGYLQWEDVPNPVVRRVGRSTQDEGAIDDRKSSLVRYDHIAEAAQLIYKAGWYWNFQDWMQQNSTFQEIEQFDIPVSLSILKIENDMIRAALFSLVQTLLRVAKTEDEALLKGIEEDWARLDRVQAEGALLAYNWIVGIARAA